MSMFCVMLIVVLVMLGLTGCAVCARSDIKVREKVVTDSLLAWQLVLQSVQSSFDRLKPDLQIVLQSQENAGNSTLHQMSIAFVNQLTACEQLHEQVTQLFNKHQQEGNWVSAYFAGSLTKASALIEKCRRQGIDVSHASTVTIPGINFVLTASESAANSSWRISHSFETLPSRLQTLSETVDQFHPVVPDDAILFGSDIGNVLQRPSNPAGSRRGSRRWLGM